MMMQKQRGDRGTDTATPLSPSSDLLLVLLVGQNQLKSSVKGMQVLESAWFSLWDREVEQGGELVLRWGAE